MMLPQRPYFPTGSLAAAIAYPSEPGAFAAEELTDVLCAVGLPALVDQLEAALYRLIAQRLAGTTIVSIGHRSTLNAFHRRSLVFASEGDHYRVREAAHAPAAL
jgi:putative ATP-binding cassette transporter